MLLITSCSVTKKAVANEKRFIEVANSNDSIVQKNNTNLECSIKTVHDTLFVNIKNWSSDFVFDMKYASKDNFLSQKIYECEECYLRFKTVQALIKANAEFLSKGYKIKIFDCYRPLDIQKKMWAKVPNPKYVANPKNGSMHNRGGAVDITLVDRNGKELNMGTAFDFFGEKSSHEYVNFEDDVINNRKILKELMIKNGFEALNSEWWHYNLKTTENLKVSNFKWDCN